MPSQEEMDRIYDCNKPSAEDAQKIQDYQSRIEELVRKVKDAEDTEINRLRAANQRQAEEITRLREVQEHILPMAKGYAAEHPVFIKSEPEVSPKHTNLPAGLVEEMWMSGERCMRQNKADALKTEPILHLPDFGTFKTTGSPTCKLHIKSEVEAKTDIHLPGCLCEGCNPKWILNKAGYEPEKGEKG